MGASPRGVDIEIPSEGLTTKVDPMGRETPY